MGYMRAKSIAVCTNYEKIMKKLNVNCYSEVLSVHHDFVYSTYIVQISSTYTKISLLFSDYRSGTVNSKSFVGKVFLRIKLKFELHYTL